MKTINTAATRPGIDNGSVTRKNVVICFRQGPGLASSKDRSIFSKATKIGKNRKGRKGVGQRNDHRVHVIKNERQRLVDQPDVDQPGVHHAVIAQNDLPQGKRGSDSWSRMGL